jgi:hypothetical protein
MAHYYDIDPQDIDPDTGRPYANYSSPSLDTSFHDGEMDIDDEEEEPDALEACKLIAAAFPPTLHRNGGQVRALAAVKAVLEREASR